uniref:RNase H type-1 domain-containing protein n=1 Tax=Cannabis sativa TaxID=3483 RepID=A0A803PL45_CANSA
MSLKELILHVSKVWDDSKIEQFACIWSIWTERNKERHDTKPKPYELLLYSTLSYLDEYKSARQSPASSTSQQLNQNSSVNPTPRWLNPPSGRLKLNTDVAVDTNKQISEFGVILRNSSGDTIAAMSKPFPGCFKQEVMEALALMYDYSVNRSAHTDAHNLAKFALSVDTECSWFEELPPPLMSIVL